MTGSRVETAPIDVTKDPTPLFEVLQPEGARLAALLNVAVFRQLQLQLSAVVVGPSSQAAELLAIYPRAVGRIRASYFSDPGTLIHVDDHLRPFGAFLLAEGGWCYIILPADVAPEHRDLRRLLAQPAGDILHMTRLVHFVGDPESILCQMGHSTPLGVERRSNPMRIYDRGAKHPDLIVGVEHGSLCDVAADTDGEPTPPSLDQQIQAVEYLLASLRAKVGEG